VVSRRKIQNIVFDGQRPEEENAAILKLIFRNTIFILDEYFFYEYN
jgi:hypothetical protein